MGLIGSRGQITWLYSSIYMAIRDVCRKHFIIKSLVHITGLISMIAGFYLFLAYLPSFISLIGVFFIFIGLVIFFTPLGLD